MGDSSYVDVVAGVGIRLIIETDPANPTTGERSVDALQTTLPSSHQSARPALRCGRVEVQYKSGNPEYFNAPGGFSEGAWGTVCQNSFGDEEAKVSNSQIGAWNS